MRVAKNRNSIEIRVWMLRNGISITDITAATDLNQSNVTRTIDGERNCRAVLHYLLENGCPAEFLELPDDMREAA